MGLFADLSGAFKGMEHNLPITRLSQYNVTPKSINLITS